MAELLQAGPHFAAEAAVQQDPDPTLRAAAAPAIRVNHRDVYGVAVGAGYIAVVALSPSGEHAGYSYREGELYVYLDDGMAEPQTADMVQMRR